MIGFSGVFSLLGIYLLIFELQIKLETAINLEERTRTVWSADCNLHCKKFFRILRLFFHNCRYSDKLKRFFALSHESSTWLSEIDKMRSKRLGFFSGFDGLKIGEIFTNFHGSTESQPLRNFLFWSYSKKSTYTFTLKDFLNDALQASSRIFSNGSKISLERYSTLYDHTCFYNSSIRIILGSVF